MLALLALSVFASSLAFPLANGQTVTATVPVGTGPFGLAYDSAKDEIFVANQGSDTVSVVSDSNNKVIATVKVGGQPESAAYDSAKGEVFVANAAVPGNVSVISDANNTVVKTDGGRLGRGPGLRLWKG
jgi:YVTN family beta-propeller protein